jgi:hypothetical protein
VSWKDWNRVRERDAKRIQEARAHPLDEVQFTYRGQFYRVIRTKDMRITFFRRQQDGATYVEEFIKNPSKTMAQKAKKLLDVITVKVVHDS